MLFQEQKKSGLVRLSDCIKHGVYNAAQDTKELNIVSLSQKSQIQYSKEIAAKMEKGEIDPSEAEELIKTNGMSLDDAIRGAAIQSALHNQCLTTILTTCFTLESYINSFAYYLAKHHGRKGKLNGKQLPYTDEFTKLSTVKKWIKVVKISTGIEYRTDAADNPFGDLKILFKFRNDHVHDKVVGMSNDKSLTSYNGKLPDPVFGLLDINHVLFAVDTYWNLIKWVHRQIGVSQEEFHMHYNLSPWISPEVEKEIRDIATTNDGFMED
ncbi:hypothetical protein [Bacillus sp. AFS055030]|uniref:hypothetical protein n=1 Tax=Bacillus sp. AFS055030 TaxID=2033507 RepID=UPI000BFB6AA2|nr:hypothetical protein [Bacillus sp. AFS055030]PGL66846.1 hypothetical protein CN925_20655 [Bacillus sp. AFS055030]